MPEQDYKNQTVEEVLEAVQNGAISAEEALEIEKQGKARKTLVEALEELITSDDTQGNNETQDSDETPEEEHEVITVKFIKNVKVGNDLYKVGDELKVTADEYEEFLKAEVIEGD